MRLHSRLHAQPQQQPAGLPNHQPGSIGPPAYPALTASGPTALPRSMERDYGWIHTLLEEAENERMHLLTFLTVFPPGPF